MEQRVSVVPAVLHVLMYLKYAQCDWFALGRLAIEAAAKVGSRCAVEQAESSHLLFLFQIFQQLHVCSSLQLHPCRPHTIFDATQVTYPWPVPHRLLSLTLSRSCYSPSCNTHYTPCPSLALNSLEHYTPPLALLPPFARLCQQLHSALSRPEELKTRVASTRCVNSIEEAAELCRKLHADHPILASRRSRFLGSPDLLRRGAKR